MPRYSFLSKWMKLRVWYADTKSVPVKMVARIKPFFNLIFFLFLLLIFASLLNRVGLHIHNIAVGSDVGNILPADLPADFSSSPISILMKTETLISAKCATLGYISTCDAHESLIVPNKIDWEQYRKGFSTGSFLKEAWNIHSLGLISGQILHLRLRFFAY